MADVDLSAAVPADGSRAAASTAPQASAEVSPQFTVQPTAPHTPALWSFFEREFNQYVADTVGGDDNYREWAFEALVDGERVGAVDGCSYWGCVFISRLMVEPSRRRQPGLSVGRRLMAQVEAYAREHGCSLITVETFDCQAPDFYPRLGFQQDLVRAGWGEGGPRGFHYFSKRVDAGSRSEQGDCAAAGASGAAAEAVVDNDSRQPSYPLQLSIRAVDTSDDATAALLHTWFRTRFDRYSEERLGRPSGFALWAFEALDAVTGKRLGAVEGKRFWGGLMVSLLMVVPSARGRGVGSALLNAAMEYGRGAGCTLACVETMDFQSPWLYERHGFCADLVRGGFEGGKRMYYFSRSLE
jgi:GNAT superfamily N-acetyltransferase